MADNKTIEDLKGLPEDPESPRPHINEGDFQAIDPHSGVKRGFKTHRLSMMALAGIIGPGLLVGSGGKTFAYFDPKWRF